jgi:hypothetical protein
MGQRATVPVAVGHFQFALISRHGSAVPAFRLNIGGLRFANPPYSLIQRSRLQAKLDRTACDTSTRRANHQNLSTPSRKNIPLTLSGKSALSARPSHPIRGAARDRHERCGGMRWTRALAIDERLNARTAKSCGPDAPTLASSS